MTRAVFLDRDGTILVERGGPPVSPAEVELLPGVVEGLRSLAEFGFVLVVVTNQSGLARGHYDENDYHAVTERMTALLAEGGVRLDAIRHCPHDSGVLGAYTCSCRKPLPGMILGAAEDLEIDLRRSFLVGDAERDLAAGKAAGCRVALVLTGKGEHERDTVRAKHPNAEIVADLAEAARWILSRSDGNGGGDES